MSGATRDEIWHEMSYVEGLHYCRAWWEEKADEIMRFDVLMCCISGSGTPRRIEVVTMGAAHEGSLV